MRRALCACVALGSVLWGLPALAGTVYVPILAENGLDNTSYLARIWLTNEGNGPLKVDYLLLPDDTDGTKGRDKAGKQPSSTTIRAGETRVLETGNGPGLLEITVEGDNADKLAVNAELRNKRQTSRAETHAELPVISSANLTGAGGTLTLQGLRRTVGGVFTNVVMVNLGHEQTHCSVKVYRTTGGQIATTALLTLKALTQVQFPDALATLGETQTRDVHARVSCDQPFFAYLTTYEHETGEVLVIEPSESGGSGLGRPGEDKPSVPGAVVFSRQGTFHTPTPKAPTAIFNIAVPSDAVFRNAVVDFDFTFAGYSKDPGQEHSIVWFHRGACCWPKWAGNIMTFANALGSKVKMVSNMDLPGSAPKSFGNSGINLQVGATYHVHFEYDTAVGVAFMEITRNGNREAYLTMPTTTNKLVPDPSAAWMIYFGHEDGTGIGPERPTYGWKYSNLRVEFLP